MFISAFIKEDPGLVIHSLSRLVSGSIDVFGFKGTGNYLNGKATRHPFNTRDFHKIRLTFPDTHTRPALTHPLPGDIYIYFHSLPPHQSLAAARPWLVSHGRMSHMKQQFIRRMQY